MVAPSMIWHVCRKLSDKRNRLEIGMPAVKTVKIIAALLIGFFLSVPHAALAQGLFEASDLNERAIKLGNAGRYSEAEPLYKQSLAIREKVLGPNHPDVAASLNNLAELYRTGRYTDAEPLLKRALAIREKSLGPDHPEVAASLNNLADCLYEALNGSLCRCRDRSFKRSLAIKGKGILVRIIRMLRFAEQSSSAL